MESGRSIDAAGEVFGVDSAISQVHAACPHANPPQVRMAPAIASFFECRKLAASPKIISRKVSKIEQICLGLEGIALC